MSFCLKLSRMRGHETFTLYNNGSSSSHHNKNGTTSNGDGSVNTSSTSTTWEDRSGGGKELGINADISSGTTNSSDQSTPFLDEIHTLYGPQSSVLARLAAKWGALVYSRPYVAILACVLFTIVASCGLTKLQVTSNPQKIWVPPGSKTLLQEQFFNHAFSPFFRINQAIFILKKSAKTDDKEAYRDLWQLRGSNPQNPDAQGDYCMEDNILRKDVMMTIANLQEKIINDQDRKGHTLNDLCFKPIEGRGCLVESPTNYWKSNITLIEKTNPLDIQQRIKCLNTDCQTDIGAPVMNNVILGNSQCCQKVEGLDYIVGNCNDCNTGAQALFLTLLLVGDDDKSDAAAMWEKDVFLKHVKNFQHENDLLDISFMAQVWDEYRFVLNTLFHK